MLSHYLQFLHKHLIFELLAAHFLVFIDNMSLNLCLLRNQVLQLLLLPIDCLLKLDCLIVFCLLMFLQSLFCNFDLFCFFGIVLMRLFYFFQYFDSITFHFLQASVFKLHLFNICFFHCNYGILLIYFSFKLIFSLQSLLYSLLFFNIFSHLFCDINLNLLGDCPAELNFFLALLLRLAVLKPLTLGVDIELMKLILSCLQLLNVGVQIKQTALQVCSNESTLVKLCNLTSHFILGTLQHLCPSFNMSRTFHFLLQSNSPTFKRIALLVQNGTQDMRSFDV